MGRADDAGLADTYEINVIAAERLCGVFIPKMAARGWGRVINISSIYGSIGQNPNNTGATAGQARTPQRNTV